MQRSAEEFVADMRSKGRNDAQIMTVARMTHGERLLPRVREILEQDTPKCEKCGCALGEGGICPNDSEHIDDVLDDDREEEYCEKCGTLLVRGVCNECTAGATPKKKRREL